MTDQLTLDQEARRLAHRADPDSAKEAAAEGALRKNSHRYAALTWHSRYPSSGLTDDEVAGYTLMEVHEARRRCSDLRNMGLLKWVEFGGVRETRPSSMGRRSTVSVITDAGYEALRAVAT